jgi:hypothetical protein
MKKLLLVAVLLAGAVAAPRAEAYDERECAHHLRAAASYMKAARFDKSRAEIAKAKRLGCPSNVSFY